MILLSAHLPNLTRVAVMSQKAMLNLEFSWGRWNGDDVQEMLEPMQIVATRIGM